MASRLRRLSPTGILLGLILLVLGILGVSTWSVTQSWWGRGTQPLQTVSRWLTNLTNRPPVSTVVTERDALRGQVDALQHQLANAQEQLQASRSLDQLQIFIQSSKRQMLPAAVVTVNPDTGIHSLVIARGSNDGLLEGQAVTTPTGTVIGKVKTVHAQLATVLLLTDGQSAIAGQVNNDQHSPGIISGERGLSLRLSYIPKTDAVEAGQVVVTSGADQRIPAGLVIGSISSVGSRSGDVFQTAAVTAPTSAASLTIVGVVLR